MSISVHRRRPRGRPLLIVLLVMCLAGGAATAALAIVGGGQASREYSFMGSLQTSDGQHMCGAALINSTTMVTAKHCLLPDSEQAGDAGQSADSTLAADGELPQDDEQSGSEGFSEDGGLFVRIGSNSASGGGELVEVAHTSMFDDSDDTVGTDIELLKLAEPVHAAPVRLADSSPPPGTPVRLLGWGDTCTDGTCAPPDGLKELDTAVADDSGCDVGGGFDADAELCIGTTESDAPCFGDSGGPALFEDGGELVLAGVTSRPADGGDLCGASNEIYTDVSAFRDWIDANSGDDVTADNCTPDTTGNSSDAPAEVATAPDDGESLGLSDDQDSLAAEDPCAEPPANDPSGEPGTLPGDESSGEPSTAPGGESSGSNPSAGDSAGQNGDTSSGGNPSGDNPFGDNPFGRNPFGGNPFGSNPFGTSPFGQ
ncbi:trypsin-like serine protease [Streptomyces sp. NPDC005728]|uniref:trypsin-like serine protease n=1 Tax=Streptomyces sp. NPDC005728 TaxID=3157054 RepID=UPI003407FB9C